MAGERNPITEINPTWVPISQAARYAGVGRAAIERTIKEGQLEVRLRGRTRLVALESVLIKTMPSDIQRLRARIERAAAWQGTPVAVREWGEAMREVLFPELDSLREAQARAALAEARLDAVAGGRKTP